MKNYFYNRQNKGITLIALVITIIILLILAGVTIAQLTESGLFEKTRLAKEKQENAEELENQILSDYESSMNLYINGSRDEASEIEVLKQKINVMSSAITTIINADSDIALSKNDVQVPLDTYTQSGTGLTAYNGGIKIGKGIKYVEISGSAYITGATNGDILILKIKNQNNESLIGNNNNTAYGSSKVYITPIVIEVNENDILYLNACNNAGTRGTISSSAAMQTRLTVKAIQ